MAHYDHDNVRLEREREEIDKALKVVRDHGLTIIPTTATDDAIEAMRKAMWNEWINGKANFESVARAAYKALVEQGKG